MHIFVLLLAMLYFLILFIKISYFSNPVRSVLQFEF